MRTKAEVMTDPSLRQIMRETGCDWSSAEEVAANKTAELRAAQERWMRELPALVARCDAAYDAALAKGGKNAAKRALRAARDIWPRYEPNAARLNSPPA